MEVSGVGAEAVIREFQEYRFERDIDGQALGAADEPFFGALVRGVVAEQARIDGAVTRQLASGWRLDRLDATVRAILRAGAFELLDRPDVPTEVVINEYLELAKSFHDGTESGFVNAALDGIAHQARHN